MINELKKQLKKLLVFREKFDTSPQYYAKKLREEFLINHNEIHNEIARIRAKINRLEDEQIEHEKKLHMEKIRLEHLQAMEKIKGENQKEIEKTKHENQISMMRAKYETTTKNRKEFIEGKLAKKNELERDILQDKVKAKIEVGSEIEKTKALLHSQSKISHPHRDNAPETYIFATPMENGIFNPKIHGEEYVEISTNKKAGELLTPALLTNSGIGTPITHGFKSNLYKNVYYVIKENSEHGINKLNGENIVLTKVLTNMPIGHSGKVNSIGADIGGPQYGV